MQYLRFSLEVKKCVSNCAAPQKSFLAACDHRNRFHPLASNCLPCASPRSEHGILGKRRVKLRSPAAGRASRGCQPDEQIRPRLSGTLWSAAVRVRGSRAQRRGRGTAQLTSPHAFVLARIRLTRMAAERGPILSGACGQVTVLRTAWNSRR